MKKELPPQSATRLINNGPCVLVTCRHEGRESVFAVSWSMPVSILPPMVGITCVRSNLSHALIQGGREFTINVPEVELLYQLFNCGKFSARDTDKFAKFGLNREPGRKVAVPSIRECAGHLECRLVSAPAFGDFTVFIGEVVAAYADEEKFSNGWIPGKARVVNHLADDLFYVPGELFKARLAPDAPVKK